MGHPTDLLSDVLYLYTGWQLITRTNFGAACYEDFSSLIFFLIFVAFTEHVGIVNYKNCAVKSSPLSLVRCRKNGMLFWRCFTAEFVNPRLCVGLAFPNQRFLTRFFDLRSLAMMVTVQEKEKNPPQITQGIEKSSRSEWVVIARFPWERSLVRLDWIANRCGKLQFMNLDLSHTSHKKFSSVLMKTSECGFKDAVYCNVGPLVGNVKEKRGQNQPGSISTGHFSGRHAFMGPTALRQCTLDLPTGLSAGPQGKNYSGVLQGTFSRFHFICWMAALLARSKSNG